MSDTVFSRARRGLGTTSLGIPDIVARTKGSPQQIMQLVMSGEINITQGLLAKRLADSVAMEARQAQMQPPTVLEEAFPQLGQQPMGQQVAPQGGLMPPAGAPVDAPTAMPQDPMAQQVPEGEPEGMAEGGLAQLDFDMPEYAGGGLVAFSDGGGIDMETLRRAFIAQESSGDYGAVNRGSGAMGAYQLMPDTARALARRAGLRYRPDLLTGERARTEEGRKYQDALGTEQLKEVMAFGGGDIRKMAGYYYGGSDTSKWGPRTRKYQEEMAARLGAGGRGPARVSAGEIGPTDVRGLPAIDPKLLEAVPYKFTEADAAVRAQLPVKTADREALRAKLLQEEDPKKTRRRDTVAGLAEFLGNLRPGTTPLEGLIQGFAAGAKSLTKGEVEREERDLKRLERLSSIEDAQNKLERDIFELSTMRARMEREGADEAQKRQLELLIQDRKMQFEANEAALARSFDATEKQKDRELDREAIGARSERSSSDFKAFMLSEYQRLYEEAAGELQLSMRGKDAGLQLRNPAEFRRRVNEEVARRAQAKFGGSPNTADLAREIASMARGGGAATSSSPGVVDFGSLK